MGKAKQKLAKAQQNKPKESELSSYRALGLIFFVAGLALIASSSTRISGVPFLALGATFIILSRSKNPPKNKK